MVRPPPQPTHRGGAGTLCVYVMSLFAYTIKMTCRPCLDTYIHTYKQTINQYKQIVIIHKSIQTYSYTYTWLQMVRPPPTHPQGGGAGTAHLRLSLTCAYHVSLAPLILSHLRLSLTCAYHVSLAPRFLSHLRLVDWCGFTHVHTCNVTRVQSATDWTASVHTLHMSTPVM